MAVRIEDVKREGVKLDIDLLASSGFESISEADRYRLKTQGICAQRQLGAFMMRVRVPGGKAGAAQLRCVADLAERYGHGSVHVTTRGGLEIHHVKIEDVSKVWEGLAAVGLTTKGTCGDTIRNVVGCAHAGVYAGEVLSIAPFIELLHEHIVSISDQTNISRKMNVAVACSPTCDDHVATSDIGLVATPAPDGEATGFAVWGGGGLGAAPRLAIPLLSFISQEDVLAAFTALVEIGKKHGDRGNRAKAKIKVLVERWGEDRFREVFLGEFEEARRGGLPAVVLAMGEATALRPAPPPRAGGPQEQKESGRYTVPALIPMGELSAGGARALADAAERFGDGIVHLTPDQNAELHDVRAVDLEGVVAAVEAIGLHARGRGGIADVVSCVGLEYCALAIAGSMTLGDEIARAMEARRLDPRYGDFRIHVSGCPHSCAKHQVADIGLAGGSMEIDGVRTEAFALNLGGNAHERRLGTVMPKRIPRARVIPVVEALLRTYEARCQEGERFSQTVARTGTEPFFAAAEAAVSGSGPEVAGGRLVVIGNGMAGVRLVEELLGRDRERFSVTIFGDEPGGSYNRIMLSGVLGGKRSPDQIVTHDVSWYAQHGIALRGAARRIDRARRVVVGADGYAEPYDVLVIATGSRAFVPPIEGTDAAGVHAFRTLEDCRNVRESAGGGKRAVVLGGGLLGLEAAAGLRALGLGVTVVELGPWLMPQQLDREGGEALRARIEALGIEVRGGARAERIVVQDGRACGVALAGGETLGAEVVMLCCGIVPETRLAAEAGLAVGRGLLVDDALRTSDERIFALGECAEHRNVTYGIVEPLWEQAGVLARRLCGEAAAYAGSRIGTRLKVAGVHVVSLGRTLPENGDEVIAAIGADGSYRRAIARDGVLAGAQVVGDPEAAASFSQAFDRNAPLAGSLAALVCGVPAQTAPRIAAVVPEAAENLDAILCVCNEVTRGEVIGAISGGARDVAEIGRVTRAGTGCGTCRGDLAELVIKYDGAHHQPLATPQAQAPAAASSLAQALDADLRRRFERALREPAAAERGAALRRLARELKAAATLLGGDASVILAE
ncbi:MAG: FAD-dependent oxidoreductase [bacterium]|nr:FAD-dependent oxidoreductase [bacterium]